jgi:protein TonB
MHPAAARRFGAPTPSIRASALALAAGMTAGALALLALGLSMHAIRVNQRAPLVVDLLPAEERVPPPEPVRSPPRHETRHRVEAPAPARLAAAPAQRMETAFVVSAPPVPPAATGSAAGGTGTSAGGNGNGPGGGGPGGNPPPAAMRPAEWVVQPSNAQLMPYNPPRAAREYVNGVADLSCKVLRTQRLKDCRIVSERPRGYGFGRAALNAAPIFRINPPMRGDMALEDERIVFSVAFNNRRRR